MSQFVSLTILASIGVASPGASSLRDSVPDDGSMRAPQLASQICEQDDDDRAAGAPTLPATPVARRVASGE